MATVKVTTAGQSGPANSEFAHSTKTDQTETTAPTVESAMKPSSIHTKTEFYQWFSHVEATRASEVEAKYRKHAEAIERQVDVCNELLGDIGSVLDIFSELKLSQRAISGRTDALKEQCDRLVSEREKLTTVTGLMKERLDHFDRLEELSSLFHAPVSASSDPHAILKGLEDLETSLKFTSKHPEYLESAKYHAKFQNLQTRAMALVKSYFQESMAVSIAECKAVALEEGGDGEGNGQEGGDGRSAGDMAIQNVKFRAVAEPRLKELMSGVCRHGDRETYKKLINDCSGAYCKARFELVRYGVLDAMQRITPGEDSHRSAAAVNTHSNETSAVQSTTATPRSQVEMSNGPNTPETSGRPMDILIGGSEIIARIAEAEIQLYRNIFPGSSHVQAASMISPLFDSMCILLAAVIEPIIYSNLTGDMNGLCRINAKIVELINHQTLGAVFNVPSLNKLAQAVELMILRQAKSDWKKGLVESDPALSSTGTDQLSLLLESDDMAFLHGIQPPLDVARCRAHQHPKEFEPVARGIRMMTAAHSSVSARSAVELVRLVVTDLLDVVHRASEPSQPVSPSESSEAYGAIFALRQLCLLSQCMSSLHVADMDLARDDHGGGSNGGVLGGQATVGGKTRGFVSSLSSKIPLLASFSSLTSRSTQGDAGMSGADLVEMMDKKTAVARDFCILTCAQDVTNPLLSFLTKVTAAKVSGREQIKSHAFATLERVKQLATDVRAAIKGPLLRHIALLYMVLPEPELSTVLDAVRGNLEDALTQMGDIVQGEYSEEEAREIGWISYEESQLQIPV